MPLPQVASVETLRVDAAAAEEEVEEAAAAEVVLEVAVPEASRYQLALGSPRHSPTVTGL